MTNKFDKFIDMKSDNGYLVNVVANNKKLSDDCKNLIKDLNITGDEEHEKEILDIFNAENIDHDQMKMLSAKKDAARCEKLAVWKYRIVEAYCNGDYEQLSLEVVSEEYKKQHISAASRIKKTISAREDPVAQDQRERVFSKDMLPHYRHAATEHEIYNTALKAAGIDIVKLIDSAVAVRHAGARSRGQHPRA